MVALYTSPRPAWISISMLAIFSWIICFAQIGFPKAILSLEYWIARSLANWHAPRLEAAMIGLEAVRTFIALAKPPSSVPIRLNAGISTLSKITSAVLERRIPIFSIFFPTVTPGRSFSTMNVASPLEPLEGSKVATTRNTLAKEALVMNIFVPLIT